ncbi:START domain-containing protein [Sediminitomix flava]|uniref:START domain-containing protein n=1 Tax=Sediminitomix flava TaxID=379075 RepID=A0A315ZC28_SEDFL|nr:START domain-containing protein [Sediminitomix flava]PWJ43091.1 START domain-containing protein [Sediminitomix flava]
MKIYLFIYVFLLLTVFEVKAQKNWEFKKEKEQIKVYLKDVEGSKLKAFKGECDIKAPISNCIALIQDIPSLADWMPNTSFAKLLSNSADSLLVYYSVSEAPWPLSPRDGIYQYVFQYNKSEELLEVNIKLEANKLPEEKDKIRIRVGGGRWLLKKIDDFSTKVIFEFHADPAGDIPSWLANSVVVDTPIDTLKNMKNLVNTAKYTNQHFSFLN